MRHYFIFAGMNIYKNKLTGLNGDYGASYFPNISPPILKNKGLPQKTACPDTYNINKFAWGVWYKGEI